MEIEFRAAERMPMCYLYIKHKHGRRDFCCNLHLLNRSREPLSLRQRLTSLSQIVVNLYA